MICCFAFGSEMILRESEGSEMKSSGVLKSCYYGIFETCLQRKARIIHKEIF